MYSLVHFCHTFLHLVVCGLEMCLFACFSLVYLLNICRAFVAELPHTHTPIRTPAFSRGMTLFPVMLQSCTLPPAEEHKIYVKSYTLTWKEQVFVSFLFPLVFPSSFFFLPSSQKEGNLLQPEVISSQSGIVNLQDDPGIVNCGSKNLPMGEREDKNIHKYWWSWFFSVHS